MVDKACRRCPWHDAEYVCTCPSNEPWQCPLNREAVEELNRWVDEVTSQTHSQKVD